MNWHGLYVTQEQLVERIFGAQIDQPATLKQILAALSGWAYDTPGRYSEIYATSINVTPAHAINDLVDRWPLIAVLDNSQLEIDHAYLLTGVEYSLDSMNQPLVHKVILRNPWPYNPSRQELSGLEFSQRLRYMVRVSVGRH